MVTRRRAGAGQDRTSQLLLEIRGARRQTDAADAVGWKQSKISRAEQGTAPLKPDEARTYATALGATPAQIRELVELCELAQPETVTGQVRLTRRGPEIQRRILGLERQASLIRSWQSDTVPGALQTWDYLVALIEREPDKAWTKQRRARMALLDDPKREYRPVVSEGALRWGVGSASVMIDQMAWLVELNARPNIDLGIVRFGQNAVPPPESAFHLFGSRAATVATLVGTTFVNDRADLDAAARVHDRLSAAAVHGDEARAALEEIAQWYRG